jgi:xanthine dehydrogenase accessory factor
MQPMTEPGPLAVVKGAGDLATGVALSLRAAGFSVVMTELAQPTAIRLTVSFAQAVYAGAMVVEGVGAELAATDGWQAILEAGMIAVLVDPTGAVAERAGASVIVDAVMAKANTGTARASGSVVIALGPGFTAGRDVDAVVETMRGHHLGRIIREGSASPDTGVPGEVGGKTAERVLRSPRDGRLTYSKRIGDMVSHGETVMRVEGQPVVSPFDGCLRGAISAAVYIRAGMKIGDVDPRGDAGVVSQVSDKARAVGRAALEAALSIGRERGLFRLIS